MQHNSYKTPNIKLYKTYSTLPVHLLYNFQILIFMHKYVYHRDKLPSVYSSYFEENTLIHHPNTGQKYQFHISSVSYEYGQEAQLMLTTRSTLTRPCRISDGLTAHTTLTKAIKYSNI